MSVCLPETFYIRTFGCQMNEHDSERIAGMLVGMGMQPVEQPGAADLLLYNTCSIREKADTRLLGHLGEARRLKREQPGRMVVVAGCLAQSRRESFQQEQPHVDILLGPQSLHELPGLIEERLETGRSAGAFAEQTTRFSAELPRARRQGPLAWVQIMTGCTNYCSYCIVPYVRGPEASRAAEEIVDEVRGLSEQGVREVTLLGQNVNAYGAEPNFGGKGDFSGLLRRLSDETPIERIRFMTSHPKDVSIRLIEALAQLEPLCEHLHLPVQSGSDRILEAMRRGYASADYLALVERLRTAVPDLSLTTDVIVGFPGETENDFAATLELVESVGYDSAFTFIYSPRTGTRAAAFADAVPADVANDRMTRLVAAVQRSALKRNQAYVGREQVVLVEGASRNRESEFTGRTRTFKTVNFSVTSGVAIGSFARVLIEASESPRVLPLRDGVALKQRFRAALGISPNPVESGR